MRRRVHLREPVGVALETCAHKMRSFLTLLGIILWFHLIVVIALIAGVNRYIPNASPISAQTCTCSRVSPSSPTSTNS